MTASLCPSDFHGTILSTEIKTEWPYSPQEEAAEQAASAAGLCLRGGQGRLAHRPQAATRLTQAQVRVAPFQNIMTVEKIFACVLICVCGCFFFLKAHLVNTGC